MGGTELFNGSLRLCTKVMQLLAMGLSGFILEHGLKSGHDRRTGKQNYLGTFKSLLQHFIMLSFDDVYFCIILCLLALQM
jgi:hypothetical protein